MPRRGPAPESAQCQGKRPFVTAAKAWGILNAMRRKHRIRLNGGGVYRLMVYRCTHCGHYHLGNT